ncbi:MAG: ribosome biogenesis GTPase Der [Candidatus Abyssobacteria bacterium SURF_5]|uniref:GTPase Der n=1 Tax=Abyssobacteria bacterium (strain SURF_5) TaxID=2093360 RepID=A0A3A4NCG1_ABYX5|nr:MAG: ribosome biogenesis GTPase Der [Candidatus Abyssubacteria bacterium SURF_5]
MKKDTNASPLVAIVGRPNVGKSTLFNRLTGRPAAIVHDEPGVTRDRIYGRVEWTGRSFDIVDTGGLAYGIADSRVQQVHKQIFRAIQDASCILFVTDVRDGVTPGDRSIADLLRQSGKPVIVAVNKADNPTLALNSAEMYSLGLDEPYPVSSLHGIGIGEVLDRIIEIIPEHVEEEQPEGVVKIAIVGQPNVGKSSLVNSLLREERVVVDEEAGTTRDSIDARFHRGGEDYILIDTAGLKKPSKVEPGIERYSVKRALQSIRRCDVALLLIDASNPHGITEQDARIANQIHESGRGQTIILNKWDIAEKDDRTFDAMVAAIRSRMPTLSYVPAISTSAKTGLRLNRIFELVKNVYANYMKRIPTSELNTFLRQVINSHPPRLKRGSPPKLLYTTQVAAGPPTIVLFMNRPDPLDRNYLRYLENQIRSRFDFTGAPIVIEVRRRERE